MKASKPAELTSAEDRAVSPVIGVILMVAITVILAAVIGTFVLDLGSQTGQTAPSVTMQMSDGNDNFDPTDDSGNQQEVLAMSHNGGDRLDGEDTRVIIRNNASSIVGQWEQGEWTDNTSVELFLQRNGADVDETNYDSIELQTGDRIVIAANLTSNDPNTHGFYDSVDYTVQVLDTESDRIVAESTVRVR